MHKIIIFISFCFMSLNQSFAGFNCKTQAVINMKNSCPFDLGIIIDDKEKKTIKPGDNIRIGDVTNGTISFTDGLKGSAKIKTWSSGNWAKGCHFNVHYDYYNFFDDPKGLNEGLNNQSSHKYMNVTERRTYTFNLNICANGYHLRPQAIGLGKIYIEKNNMLNDETSILLDNKSDQYDIYFSAINTACHVKYAEEHYLLSCDNTNVKGLFANSYKDLVFICQQMDYHHGQCPYVKANQLKSSKSYSYNIY